MIIQIHGGEFRNKGAELMLRTTVYELGQRIPGFVPVVDIGCGPFDQRCQLGLHHLIPPRGSCYNNRRSQVRHFVQKRIFGRYKGLLKNYGCELIDEVDGLVDISGFAFTDQWPDETTQRFAELSHYYKSRGKPVILLPQALGPFCRAPVRSAFIQILENADIIFARDCQSYRYVADLSSNLNKVAVAPDITLFYPKPAVAPSLPQQLPYACVVPNIRLLHQGKESWGDKYEAYLVQIVKELIKQGVKVRLLVHEEGGDLNFVTHIAQLVAEPIEIVQEKNSIVLKQIISQGLLLVGSRYHSLVASFASAVPAICMGWSHKYETLFAEFGCEKFIVSHNSAIEDVISLVRELTDEQVNAKCRMQIASRLQVMHQKNEQMWGQVVAALTV